MQKAQETLVNLLNTTAKLNEKDQSYLLGIADGISLVRGESEGTEDEEKHTAKSGRK